MLLLLRFFISNNALWFLGYLSNQLTFALVNEVINSNLRSHRNLIRINDRKNDIEIHRALQIQRHRHTDIQPLHISFGGMSIQRLYHLIGFEHASNYPLYSCFVVREWSINCFSFNWNNKNKKKTTKTATIHWSWIDNENKQQIFNRQKQRGKNNRWQIICVISMTISQCPSFTFCC